MTSDRPALLLTNPHSRLGKQGTESAAEALRQARIEFHSPDWTHDSLPGLVGQAGPGFGSIIVAGGDGTISGVAGTLLKAGLPVGLLPTGTANDLARTLGIPPELPEAARIIAAGHTRPVDVGMANDIPFFNVASIGFGVDLTRALTRDSKQRWGSIGYAVAALRVLRRLRPFTAHILLDGQDHVSRTVHLAVGNGRHYGGGMTVRHDARIDDARLDVFSLQVSSTWRLLRLLPALRHGRHDPWTEIHTLAGQSLRVTTTRPRSVNLDGEIRTRTPVEFRVRPAALRVFVPAGQASPAGG